MVSLSSDVARGVAPPLRVTLPRASLRSVIRRAFDVARVTRRHFTPLLRRRRRGVRIADTDIAHALRNTFADLGGSFVKFGQLIASSPGVFGVAIADEFRSCLDTGPSEPFADIRTEVEVTHGRPLAETFASFDQTPIGRASVAVVHSARLRGGRVVAVKVLRPGIEHLMATDLRLMEPLLRFLARRVGLVTAGQLFRMLASFREQVSEELDLRNELRAMAHFRRVLEEGDLPAVTVPEPLPELCGPRVLVMEFLEGVPIDDLSHVAEFGLDPRPIVDQIVRGWFLTTLRDGLFHGDVHAGNLMLLRDGRIGVLDWGIVGRLDAATHRFYRRLIEACLGDQSGWHDVAQHVASFYGAATLQTLGLDGDGLVSFVRGLLEPILTAPLSEVNLFALVAAVQGQTIAEGPDASVRPRLSTWRRMREQRRFHAQFVAHGGLGGRLDRNMFLLGKQIMYFERYGKMFIPDLPLLADREFYRRLMGIPARHVGED